jgi:hypothetical protein
MAPTTRRALALTSFVLLIACASALREPSPRAEADESKPRQSAPPGGGAVSWSPVEQERELGQVRWRRDYDVARAEAKRRSRPLFVLFDEVPG